MNTVSYAIPIIQTGVDANDDVLLITDIDADESKKITIAELQTALSVSSSGGTVQAEDGTYDIQAANEGATAGNARGEYSVDLQTDRSSVTMIASGANSVILGGQDGTASGSYSSVIGGQNNVASSLRSIACGGEDNAAATGFNAGVFAGNSNSALSNDSVALGGVGNTSSGIQSAVIGGSSSSTNAKVQSAIITSNDSTSSHTNSVILASSFGGTLDEHSLSMSSGSFTGNIKESITTIIAKQDITSSATPQTRTIAVPGDSVWLIEIYTAAISRDGGTVETAAYKTEVFCERLGAAAVNIHSNTTTVVHEDDSAWNFSVSASSGNIVLNHTGDSTDTVFWTNTVIITHATATPSPPPGSGSGSAP